jgi:hypothetical protein
MHKNRFREKIRDAKVTVRGVTAKIMPNIVYWLGMILDRKLTLRCHYMICLQKAISTEIQLCTLYRANSLTLELVRKL